MSPADSFIDRMLTVFHAPLSENPAAFIAEMRKALSGWDRQTLDTAADRLAKTCKFFPKPAEVIEVCEQIVNERPQPPVPERNVDWTADALKTADKLIQSDMGRRAAREGWITQLHDYCRKHRALPPGRAIADLQHEARLFEEAYSSVCSGNGGTLQASLKVLGESMLARRSELAEIASGSPGLTEQSRRMTGDAP